MQEIALKDENLILVVAKIIFNIFFKFQFSCFWVVKIMIQHCYWQHHPSFPFPLNLSSGLTQLGFQTFIEADHISHFLPVLLLLTDFDYIVRTVWIIVYTLDSILVISLRIVSVQIPKFVPVCSSLLLLQFLNFAHRQIHHLSAEILHVITQS